MNRYSRYLLTCAVILPFAAVARCATQPHDSFTQTKIVTIQENQAAPNITPPTELNVIMFLPTISDAEIQKAAARCNLMGGEPIWYPLPKNQMICERVDY